MGTENPPTHPIFTALAAALAAIEGGAIEQAEIEWNRSTDSGEESSTDVLTLIVYRHAQPRFGTIGGPSTPKE